MNKYEYRSSEKMNFYHDRLGVEAVDSPGRQESFW
jgi:hypothetical protein